MITKLIPAAVVGLTAAYALAEIYARLAPLLDALKVTP